jgi:hypothetical protein
MILIAFSVSGRGFSFRALKRRSRILNQRGLVFAPVEAAVLARTDPRTSSQPAQASATKFGRLIDPM